MIARLVVRDRAALAILALWPGGAVVGYLAADVVRRAAEDGPIDALPGPLAFLFAVMWAAMASVNYLSGGGREVASRFHMALPISGRELWVARMITLYAPFGGAIALGFGTFLLLADPVSRRGAGVTAANALAIAAFVPALYHSARVRYAERGMPLEAFIPILLLSLGMYGVWGAASPAPGAVLGLASAVLLASTYLRIPGGFEVAESEGTVRLPSFPLAHAAAQRIQALPGVGRCLRVYQALRPRRWLNKDQFTLLVLLGVATNALLLARSPLSALVAPVIVQVAWLIRTTNGASRLDHLPVDRRRIYRHAVLPPFVAGSILVAAGVLWSDSVTWRMLAGSPPVAMAALLYAIVWALAMSTVLGEMATPRERGRASRLSRPILWAWAVFLASLVGARWTATPGLNVVLAVQQRLPLPAAQVWALTGVVLWTGYMLTVRQFSRAEIVGLSRGLVT